MLRNWTFNNVRKASDTRSRVLAALGREQRVPLETIARRSGFCRDTARQHLNRLVLAGEVTMVLVNGKRTWSRGASAAQARRRASIHFAGPCTIGRGLANWGVSL